MNANSKITAKSAQWRKEFELDLREFDTWMTRQLNCLVGRSLSFATPARTQSDEGRERGGSLSHRDRS